MMSETEFLTSLTPRNSRMDTLLEWKCTFKPVFQCEDFDRIGQASLYSRIGGHNMVRILKNRFGLNIKMCFVIFFWRADES